MRGVKNDAACSVEGCSSRSWGKGLCQRHYTRQRRSGSTDDPVEATPLERWESMVDKTDTCWLWTGRVTVAGYGQFSAPGRRSVHAHRWGYEQLVGQIDEGLSIDHLCRVRACVNPAHLEPVTTQINVLRGVGWAAQNAAKTHCKRNHEFTPENTYLKGGRRVCRQCLAAARASAIGNQP